MWSYLIDGIELYSDRKSFSLGVDTVRNLWLLLHFKDLEIDQVVIGATSVCAVTMDSELKCWGHGKEVKNQPQGLLVA